MRSQRFSHGIHWGAAALHGEWVLILLPHQLLWFYNTAFRFSELGGSVPSMVHPLHQHREEQKSPEPIFTTVGLVKLEEGSYLNALCRQCGSIQTLRIMRAGDILTFSSVHKGDSGRPSAPNPLSPIHNIVCICPVCTTSAELIKEAGKYVWKLRYSAAPQTPSESSISAAACPTSGADQLGFAASQGPASRMHVAAATMSLHFVRTLKQILSIASARRHTLPTHT